LLLGVDLPRGPLWVVIGMEIGTNLACDLWARRGRPVAQWLLGALLTADVCFLTALLALTGGAANPFSFLYLIHVTLGAIALRPAWAWGIVTLSITLFGTLFLLPESHDGHAHHFRLHLAGMWLAFALAAWFIVYFVQRVTSALRIREHELATAKSLTARHERLASLTTLAAGAAHELGSPLATIAIAAKELERQLDGAADCAGARDDAHLIRVQVERCSAILRQLTEGAGGTLGEQPRLVTADELIANALRGLEPSAPVQVELGRSFAEVALLLPLQAAALALGNIVKNALDAAPGEAVTLGGFAAQGQLHLEIRDRGRGMSAEVIDRLGEPFFTTKEAGHGMGLGLFLSRSILDRMGGRLEIESRPGHGTLATVVLPAQRERA
ncbi:MAG TPA: ATP-binding protein, partial [Terriglobales bacterium]|nr:ATP-binding protein [Terriglobales bacterium]